MKKLKVYVGSSMANIHAIGAIQARISEFVEVCSTWALSPVDRPAAAAAAADLRELMAADVVILDVTVPSTSGGYHTEAGLALASGKPLVIIGESTNVFFQLAQRRCEDWDEAIAYLRAYIEVLRVCG